MIYADNAATTSVSKTALDAMLPYLTTAYGNPSSSYSFGRQANRAIASATETVARCLNAEPKEIYFTSGGSEADNQAILSAARAGLRRGRKHIISTPFEHHAVLHTLDKLKKEGFDITLLDVHEDGVVRVEELKEALREDTCLVTVMFANNEVGTVQPIPEIGALCRERGIPFHTDAVQAAGHMPIDRSPVLREEHPALQPYRRRRPAARQESRNRKCRGYSRSRCGLKGVLRQHGKRPRKSMCHERHPDQRALKDTAQQNKRLAGASCARDRQYLF